MNFLDAAADLASVVTAAVAGLAYGKYRTDAARRRKLLEARLKLLPGSQIGAPPAVVYMIELMTQLRMSEQEIWEAARSNPNVRILYDAHGSNLPMMVKLRCYQPCDPPGR